MQLFLWCPLSHLWISPEFPRISHIFNDIPVSFSKNFSYFQWHSCFISPDFLIFQWHHCLIFLRYFSYFQWHSYPMFPEFLIFSMTSLSHVLGISHILSYIPVSFFRNYLFSMTSLSCDPRISHIFNNIPVLISRNFSFPTTPLPQRHSLTHSKQWKTAERLRCT